MSAIRAVSGPVLGLFLLATLGALHAQGGPPPQGATQQPTFRVAIDLVTLDVIPRDARGQFVANLAVEDFEVLEDSVKQEIASLTLVHGGRVYDVQALAPPVQEGIILPTIRSANQPAGRIFLIVVDDLHLNAHDTPHVRALLKKIASTLIHEGDMFMMISTGTSSIEEPITYDRNRIQAAIGKVKGGGLEIVDL
ncbi:MAG: hypothetical protein HY654_07490, partial [Acidobacteria bacterium]|nr:hypothetical protein [Acidobacteriota bacterium]